MTVKKVTTAVFLTLLSIEFFSCSSDSGNEEESTSSSSSSSSQLSSSSSISNSSSSVNSYGMLTDTRDGNTYRTVEINTQVWMAENLNYTPESGSFWCYDGDEANCTTYGRLYDWATAMNIDAVYNSSLWGGSDVNHQGICPAGWHLPSYTEWTTLTDYVGGSSTAGTKLKAKSGWNSSGVNEDTYDFSALPGGYGLSGGNFHNVGSSGDWLGATEYNTGVIFVWSMFYEEEYVDRKVLGKTAFRSVRCLRD